MLPLLVIVEVVRSLGITSFLVPVADQSLSLELAGVVGSLLYDEVTIHLSVTIIRNIKWSFET